MQNFPLSALRLPPLPLYLVLRAFQHLYKSFEAAFTPTGR